MDLCASLLILIVIVLYSIAFRNRIIYLRKFYFLDLESLEKQGKSEVAAIRTKMLRDGTSRYASQTADGIIGEVQRRADERISRRKLKYRYDRNNSFITALTVLLGITK